MTLGRAVEGACLGGGFQGRPEGNRCIFGGPLLGCQVVNVLRVFFLAAMRTSFSRIRDPSGGCPLGASAEHVPVRSQGFAAEAAALHLWEAMDHREQAVSAHAPGAPCLAQDGVFFWAKRATDFLDGVPVDGPRELHLILQVQRWRTLIHSNSATQPSRVGLWGPRTPRCQHLFPRRLD